MPATPLNATERHIQPGVTKLYWVPTIAATDGIPTRVELDAGTDLTDEVAGASGWLTTSAFVEVPDLGHTFTGKVPGKTSAADSSISFWADKSGDDVRAVLERGVSGYIVWADGGDVVDYLADAYKVEVASVGKVRNVEGTAALMLQVDFAILTEPVENFALPATA